MEAQSTDRSTYYYADGKKIPLIPEPRFYSVRFTPGKDSRDVGLSRKADRVLREDSLNVGFIPQYGMQLYEAISDRMSSTTPAEKASDIARMVRELNDERPIDFATMSYQRTPARSNEQQPDLMFVTRTFVVQFNPEISLSEIQSFNARYGVKLVEPLTYVANGYVAEAPDASGELGAVSLSNTYHESGLVVFAHPDFIHKRHLRGSKKNGHQDSVAELPQPSKERDDVTDRADFLSQQWHLSVAKVPDAWTITRGRADIKIAILDDGIDTGHPEFAGKIVGQRDFATNQADANPKSTSDNHGTACAGCATAKGVKAFGSAPGCSLLAVRTPEFLGVTEEANMFRWVADQGADVISCSWGPADGTGSVDPLPDNVRAAIRYCITNGRGGKGIPIFWAAGNGNESVSLDGYASNPDVMAIAASTSSETRSWYSDMGPEVFICAPSSGDRNLNERRIFTTDRRNNSGYNPDPVSGATHPASDLNYTDDFGGTSAATPLVAGIAGLILSANPALTRDQVRDILRRSTDRIGQASDYDSNGHSDLFGFGRVNAMRAVQAAQASGSGAVPTGSNPSISGPTSMRSSDSAPAFQINKAGRSLFAVEVTSNPQLFVSANSSQRTPTTFYGSWQDTALMSGTTYQLPAAVWNNLKNAPQLFYRVHVADTSSWGNHAVSTQDGQVATAPSFAISSGSGAVPTGSNPSISGPTSMRSSDSAPAFQINKAGRALFAVEVTSNPQLFVSANSSQRTPTTFYGSWQDTALMSGTTYQLPAAVWNNLKNAPQLFYRVHVADTSSWGNHAVSTQDGQVATAPSFPVSNTGAPRDSKDSAEMMPRSDEAAYAYAGNGRASRAENENRTDDNLPTILGPERYQATAAPLSFQLTVGNNAYYAVEIAADTASLLNKQHEGDRTVTNFYASWQYEGLLPAGKSTVYILPLSAWERLSKAFRLYYRVITAADPSPGWLNCQVSVPDSEADNAPFVELAGGLAKKTEIVAPRWLSAVETRHTEEGLWRNEPPIS